MSYAPIEDHGIIGDLYSAALVDTSGTIDWCCLPHFDSPSVFAAILAQEVVLNTSSNTCHATYDLMELRLAGAAPNRHKILNLPQPAPRVGTAMAS